VRVRACMRACVCVRARACACVRTCVRAWVGGCVQVRDSLHLVLEYHEKVATASPSVASSSSAAAAAAAAAPVMVTELKSYSPDKFVVLCDEALGPRLQYPHLPGTATSQAAAEEAAASSVPTDRGAGSKVFALAPDGSDAKENVPNGVPNGRS
jgi:hypothetical protein